MLRPLHVLAARALVLASAAVSTAASAAPFVYLTNWYAQAEHGGFYQAQAQGLYKQAGLEVAIRMGGPQINIMQQMLAGKADCIMGYDVETMKVWEQGIEAVTVAAVFQKDPAVLVAHPDVKRMEDLKSRTLLIGAASRVSFWPWLKAQYGFTDEQTRPYAYNIQPFLADKNIAQQGYLASEPHSIEKATGKAPKVFVLADHGWPPYATTVVCSRKTLQQRPKEVAAFVKASMLGWKSYLQGDPTPANTLIKKDNPNMTDDLLAYGIGKLKSEGVVLGGDAATQGIGTLTDARMKATFDLLVRHQLIDPAKVNVRKTYTTEFVKNLKVLP